MIEGGSPEAPRGPMGCSGLEIVRVVEGSGPGEEDGCTGWVENGVGERECGDVEGLEMGVGMAVDLSKNW